MTIAHIAGVPFEEWLVPLAATGGVIPIVLRATFRRLHQQQGVHRDDLGREHE